jgi:hypothetical protein
VATDYLNYGMALSCGEIFWLKQLWNDSERWNDERSQCYLFFQQVTIATNQKLRLFLQF